MNRKKVIISFVFAIVIALTGTLAIVINNINNRFQPFAMNLSAEERQTVSGNGTGAVMVGEYLYFIGNHVDRQSITFRQNEYNNIEFGAIYRVKFYPSGDGAGYGAKPKYEQMNDSLVDLRDNPFKPQGVQLVVPKIAGFENSALWVFDTYLIYTSPNNSRDRNGRLQSHRTDFFRVDLNGKNHRKIYTTETSVTANDFTVCKVGGRIYVLVNNNGKLVRVNASNQSFGRAFTISESATNVVFPIVRSYIGNQLNANENINGKDVVSSYSDIMSFVFFTEDLDEEDAKAGRIGNVLKRFPLELTSPNKNSVSIVGNSQNMFYDPIALSNGKFMVSVFNASSSTTIPDVLIIDSLSYRSNNNVEVFNFTMERVETKNGTTITHVTNSAAVLNPGSPAFERSKINWQSGVFQPEEEFYLPTEHHGATPRRDWRFVSLMSNGESSSMFVYSRRADGIVTLVNTIPNVSAIVEITNSDIFYTDSAGSIIRADLSTGTVHHSEIWTPMDQTSGSSVSMFNRGGQMWYFYIQDIPSDAGTTNSATIVDFRSTTSLEVKPQYILTVIPDRYLSTEFRSK
jgi:hypothetical protein